MASPAPLFTEAVTDRSLKFLIRLSPAERERIREEARNRGVKPTTIVRECLRKILCQMPAPKK